MMASNSAFIPVSTRRFGEIDVNLPDAVVGDDNAAAVRSSPAKKLKKTPTSPLKILTFLMDKSPAYFKVLSKQSLETLIDIVFRVCDPRDGEQMRDHLWTLKVQGTTYSGPQTPDLPDFDDNPIAFDTSLNQALAKKNGGKKISTGTKLYLEYDFGVYVQSYSHSVICGGSHRFR
jgi:hypothetical protein